MQEPAPDRHGPPKRSQVARIAEHQGRREQALPQQALLPVHVVEDGRQQTRALHDPGLDLFPIFARDYERQQVQRPSVRGVVLVAVYVVGDAVLAHLAGQQRGAAVELGDARRPHVLEKLLPDRP